MGRSSATTKKIRQATEAQKPPPPDTLAILAYISLAAAMPVDPNPRRRTVVPHDPATFPLFDACLCRMCRRNHVQRRGVCERCRRTQRYRDIAHPADMLYSRHLPITPAEPTTAAPGTDEKVRVMIERVAAGFAINHPGDPDLRPKTNITPREAPGDESVVSRGAAGTIRRERYDAGGDVGGPVAIGVTARGVHWTAWLPECPSRDEIRDAINAHVGVIVDDEVAMFAECDGLLDVSNREDEFYCHPVHLMMDDEDGKVLPES